MAKRRANSVLGGSYALPEMVARHVVYVLEDHVKPDSIRVTVTLDAPGLLVSVIALSDGRGSDHHAVRPSASAAGARHGGVLNYYRAHHLA